MPTVAQRIETPPIGYSNYVKPLAEKPLRNGKDILADIPTEDTVMAMEETMNDIKNGNMKVFYNSDELMNNLLAD